MISQVKIKLVTEQFMGDFYFSSLYTPKELAHKLMNSSAYREVCEYFAQGEGEQLAEHAFDLTNNPSMQAQRELTYGRHRSVSVGDIVEVNGVPYLCESQGWASLA